MTALSKTVLVVDEHSALRNQILKLNLLEIAREHKRKCGGRECNVSISLLFELGRKAGLTFTAEELTGAL